MLILIFVILFCLISSNVNLISNYYVVYVLLNFFFFFLNRVVLKVTLTFSINLW